MRDKSDPATLARSVAFAKTVAEELRALAAGEKTCGEGLVWMLAVLTTRHPDLEHAVAVRRLVAALLVESGPMVWQHVRDGAGSVS
ncbi:hypothetical protein [Roseomonas sp. CECT 9278]|uniref:hypothetical protein n=1 Tax=Roseomonas sp. CECT 9278 TaxID=2845823 RepID=UPI001E39317C|nr:hypothetical protein [Roseomonas sp. CECT 9278]CAH0251119.1 hypothetical protein ROS9278_03147 [Roseomonas sp. CECT 9278]